MDASPTFDPDGAHLQLGSEPHAHITLRKQFRASRNTHTQTRTHIYHTLGLTERYTRIPYTACGFKTIHTFVSS
jgi:hypothetical protein